MTLELTIIEAYVGGVSVVEIGRVLGTRPERIHSLLRKKHAIEALTEKPAKGHACNAIWLHTLSKYGLSLERWCVAWGFSVEDALAGMNGGDNVEVQEALMRDFPTQYRLVFKQEPTRKLKIEREKLKHARYSIEWDAKCKQYRCTVQRVEETSSVDVVDVPSYGFTPVLALTAAEDRLKELLRIRRLQSAIRQVQQD